MPRYLFWKYKKYKKDLMKFIKLVFIFMKKKKIKKYNSRKENKRICFVFNLQDFFFFFYFSTIYICLQIFECAAFYYLFYIYYIFHIISLLNPKLYI